MDGRNQMPPGEGIVCTKCERLGRVGHMKVNFMGHSVNMKCDNSECDSEY